MASLKKGTVDAGLAAKGFRMANSDHLRLIYHDLNGRKTAINTKTSHGASGLDIGDPLLAKMARQCRLPKAMFLDLVNCPLEQGAYEDSLHANGHL